MPIVFSHSFPLLESASTFSTSLSTSHVLPRWSCHFGVFASAFRLAQLYVAVTLVAPHPTDCIGRALTWPKQLVLSGLQQLLEPKVPFRHLNCKPQWQNTDARCSESFCMDLLWDNIKRTQLCLLKNESTRTESMLLFRRTRLIADLLFPALHDQGVPHHLKGSSCSGMLSPVFDAIELFPQKCLWIACNAQLLSFIKDRQKFRRESPKRYCRSLDLVRFEPNCKRLLRCYKASLM